MRFEKGRNTGCRGLSRPHSYVGKYSPEFESVAIYGILERKKFLDDLWSSCKPEVQIWESAFLVSRLLCQYGLSGYTRNNSVYSESTGGRSGNGTINIQRVYRPVYGQQEWTGTKITREQRIQLVIVTKRFKKNKRWGRFSSGLWKSCNWRIFSEPVSGCRQYRLEGVVHTTG